MLAVTLSIYWQDLTLIFSRALVFSSANIGNYVLVIPLLAALILYRKRRVLFAASSIDIFNKGRNWTDGSIAISLCVIAAILYIYGSSTLYSTEFHIYSMPIFLSGVTALLFNLKTLRHAFFAIFLLFFLHPPTGEVIGEIAADLSWISAVSLNSIFDLIGVNTNLNVGFGGPALEIERLDGSRNIFAIGEPSSGVYSTIGMSVFALFVAYIASGKVWKRIAIFALSFPMFFALNIVRIGIIIGIWYVADEVAAEAFHIIGGILMVTIGTIILLVIGERLFGVSIYSKLSKHSQKCPICDHSAKMNENFCMYCGRLIRLSGPQLEKKVIGKTAALILLSASVVFGQSQINAASAATGFEQLDITSIDGPETTQYVLPIIDGYDAKFAYRDDTIEKVLRQDASLAYTYTEKRNPQSGATSSPPVLFVGIQISTGRHTWEDSLVIHPSRVGRPTATVLELSNIEVSSDKEARFFVYQKPESQSTEAVLYWFERLPFYFGDHYESRNIGIILWSSVESLVRSGKIQSAEDVGGIERYLATFARPIEQHWESIRSEIVQSTLLNQTITENGITFLALAPLPASAIGITHLLRNHRLKVRNEKLLERIAPKEEVGLFDAIMSTDFPTGAAIAESYKSQSSDKTLDLLRFVNMISSARKAGLVAYDIGSQNDEPYAIWRTTTRNSSLKVLRRYVARMKRF